MRSSEDRALVAKHGKKKINPNITCYGCGKKGHISHQCKENKLGKGKSTGDQKGATMANAVVEDNLAFCGDDLALVASPDSWLLDSAVLCIPPRVHMDSTQKMAFTGLESSPVQSSPLFSPHFSLKLSLKSNDIYHSVAFFELSLKIVILY